MTDRERDAPPRLPRAAGADFRPGSPTGDRPTPHQDSAPQGDGPAMPLTLVTPTQGRSATDTPPPSPAADRGRSWLARLFAGDFAFPAVAPVAVPLPGRTAAEADALSRALGCRDLFVIDAIDRSVRERVIAELARAAA